MNEATLFLSGVGLTLAASFAVVLYLRPHLYAILVDLCATSERARFWTAFSNITLSLTPLIFAMQYRPSLGPGSSIVLEIGSQVKWALIGLVCSVVVLGIVISRFIPPARPSVRSSPGA